tara:strand:+ start:967 stop:1392 length:426 start_codon:yes stop_codon:yes gene_type:complete
MAKKAKRTITKAKQTATKARQTAQLLGANEASALRNQNQLRLMRGMTREETIQAYRRYLAKNADKIEKGMRVAQKAGAGVVKAADLLFNPTKKLTLPYKASKKVIQAIKKAKRMNEAQKAALGAGGLGYAVAKEQEKNKKK